MLKRLTKSQRKFLKVGSYDVIYEVWKKDDFGDNFSCYTTFHFKQPALDYVSILRSHGIDSFVCEVNRDIIEE